MSNLQILADAEIEAISGGFGVQIIGLAVIRQASFGAAGATASGGNGGGFLGGGAGGGAVAVAANLQANSVNALAF